MYTLRLICNVFPISGHRGGRQNFGARGNTFSHLVLYCFFAQIEWGNEQSTYSFPHVMCAVLQCIISHKVLVRITQDYTILIALFSNTQGNLQLLRSSWVSRNVGMCASPNITLLALFPQLPWQAEMGKKQGTAIKKWASLRCAEYGKKTTHEFTTEFSEGWTFELT